MVVDKLWDERTGVLLGNLEKGGGEEEDKGNSRWKNDDEEEEDKGEFG